ncbi:MAG: enolase C-terminal domain-like protein [Pseudohongiellaceae bacterium]
MLRLLAREADVSLESILELPELSGVFKYSAIIGSRDSAQFRDQFQQYLEFGFTDFKIKIFGDTGTDYANRKNLLDNGTPDLTVRADANSIWSSAGAAIEYFKNLDYPFVAIEEPLKKGQFSDCKIIAESLGIPVILDESFTRVADFNDISADPASWIANLRISKMGGILRSLEIAEMAKQNGVSIILGAQVGESSILTRMALVVANMYRNSVIAQEGAFGSRLLTRDLVDPPIEFGAGGILKAEDIYDLIRPVG